MIGPDLFPLRLHLLADVGAVLAAGVELTALGWIDGAGDIAFQEDGVLLCVGVGGRDGSQEGDGVGVGGVVKELNGVGQLDEVTQIHDTDAVADMLDDREVVGDEEVGKVVPLFQVLEEVDDLGLDGHVEGGDRLIADHEAGLDGQAPGDADALALAAGELVGVSMEHVWGQAALLHDLDGVVLLALAVLLEEVVGQQPLADDLTHRHAGVKGGVGVLEDDLHVPAEMAHLVVAEAGQVDAIIAVCFVPRELGVGAVLVPQGVDCSVGSVQVRVQLFELRVELVPLARQGLADAPCVGGVVQIHLEEIPLLLDLLPG